MTTRFDHEFAPQNYRTQAGKGRYLGFNGNNAPQRENELLELLAILRERNVQSYLEIGLERGITFHAIASQMAKGSRCVGVDKPMDALTTGGPETISQVCTHLAERGKVPITLWGDSSQPGLVSAVQNLGPYDFILIDGDHTLEGVSRDWQNFGPHGKMVAFHDIATDWEEGCKVNVLWEELKKQHDSLELFGAPSDVKSGMGIGILFL